jgi:hypothetical protein
MFTRLYKTVIIPIVMVSALFGKDYKGAEYRTIDNFTYGRFETRYQPPKQAGMLASFFTYHEIESLTDWNEIDIEVLGRYDNDIQFASIGPLQRVRSSHHYLPFTAGQDFHTYAFEWTPDYIAWFIDGNEVFRQTGEFIADFNKPQKLMMNIWPPQPGAWADTLNPAGLPLFARYDYASYASYTPGNGDTGTDNNFTLQWQDDFDSWDQTRWQKATHTWGGNDSDFIEENAVLQDGMLILCLTHKDAPAGYVDTTPPSLDWARGYGNLITVHFTEDVDSVSASNPQNYAISGVNVNRAVVLENRRTVELGVSELDSTYSGNVVALRIKDAQGNLSPVSLCPLKISRPLTFPAKINVGGDAVDGFLASQAWDPTFEYGYQDGYPELWPVDLEIGNTEQDVIYRSAVRGAVNYKIRVPNGEYRVTLMMCENDTTVQYLPRIVSVRAEGELVASELNLFETAGYHNAYEVTAENVLVLDKELDLHFTNYSNIPVLNGIVVEQLSTAIENTHSLVPVSPELKQNYPNPFNPVTTIAYQLPQAGKVRLSVYDTVGREVEKLVAASQSAGEHKIRFDATSLSSGIYFYRLQVQVGNENHTISKKMVFLK